MKKIFNIICCNLILFFILGFCCACNVVSRDYVKNPLTIEEIKVLTQDKFFDKNGNAYSGRWGKSINGDKGFPVEFGGGETMFITKIDKITGFDVHVIKGVNSKSDWYLVEFDESGFFAGQIEKEFTIEYFLPYPSPFKILNISIENSYLAYENEFTRELHFATIIDGKMTDIKDDAWYGTVFPYPKNYEKQEIIYNYETKTWTKRNRY